LRPCSQSGDSCNWAKARDRLRRQPRREAASSKDRASRRLGSGFGRKRGGRPAVNGSVLAQYDVTEASTGFDGNRETERKIVFVDGAHSLTGLIVGTYPGLRVRPVYPCVSCGPAREPGNVLGWQPRTVGKHAPLAAFTGKHRIKGDTGKLWAVRRHWRALSALVPRRPS
jgi:hypothetical protein